MARQNELSVISQLNRVHITLRSQYRVLKEVLNHPSAADKVKQMIDLCVLVEGELSKKLDGNDTAHNSNTPTIGSWTPKVDIDTVITCYANVYVAKDTSGSIWNTFVNAYNELNETERDAIYSELCNISNSNPPYGFEPIGENNENTR